MALAVSYQLALAAAAKQLTDALPNATERAADVPYRQILLSAEGGVAYVGGANTGMGALVTSTNYGVRVEIGATAVEPVSIGPFETGPIKLSQLWAAGAGSTLHMLCIPF